MSKFRIRGRLTNVHSVSAPLRRTVDSLDRFGAEATRKMAQRSVEELRAVAPKGRTGALERGISARRRGFDTVDVTISAIAPESGYNYGPVTRFGHRVEDIFPTEGRSALKVRFQHGETKYRASVRGFRPHGDWVDRATPQIDAALDEVVREVGRDLQVRLFS